MAAVCGLGILCCACFSDVIPVENQRGFWYQTKIIFYFLTIKLEKLLHELS